MPAASPTVTTSYTVTAIDTYGCVANDNITVTVNPLPVVTATATSPVCAGSTATLNASGAVSYNWQPGNLSGATVTDAPTVTTTYTVTGTDGNGCTNTATVMVTVNPLPNVTATSTGPICAGNSAQLSASGASTYNWQPGNLSGASVTVAPTSTTTYTVTGTDANGCSNTATVTLTVNPLPVVTLSLSPDTVCLNWSPYPLTGGSPPGGTYTGPGVNAGIFDPNAAGMGMHSIVYTYTDGNNCTASDTGTIYVDLCTGIEIPEQDAVSVFPNPVNENNLVITFHPAVPSVKEIALINPVGQIVFIKRSFSRTEAIDMNSFASGIYFLRVQAGHLMMNRKIVKE
jgi:hypothetical protein